MEALKNILSNVPNWSKRLDELTDQIDKRQLELAELAEQQSGSDTRSLRNRGSTESLKPKDDINDHLMTSADGEHPNDHPQDQIQTAPLSQDPPLSPMSDHNTPSAMKRQSHQVMAVAQARARATVKRKIKTESLMSAEGLAPKYRTRNMIIVYYDSYVQSFFEELVKFVSASRNLMRKAKMAAKVAQIRKMAEMEMPDDEETNENNNPGAPLVAADGPEANQEPLPALRYMSTRRLGPISRVPGAGMRSYGRGMGGLGSLDDKPDIYDELDKALEYVQGMCEHGAHQFLRDGNCTEEISNIQRRLTEARDTAEKEMERIKREEPESLEQNDTKTRAFKPMTMRKIKEKESTPPPGVVMGSGTIEAIGASNPGDFKLEVDEGVDEGVDDLEPPKLVYRSTRHMRAHRPA